ncbi:putative lipid II flippase FtsW [Fontisphaera persica]|uniref:putative lipid II flippase FtsW n=1 Tax=Fontisphaera persica TaxID=2974023 RepID=UPI0024BF463B|nr:putative lipid II flippase FtsW [Fontisphaera persica]WCJ58011.1 putative lipid II flippase FtsW [Fontisphaera persica]
MHRPKNTLPLVAHLLIVCVGVLLALGMVSLYSASMTLKGAQLVQQQLLWCGLGLVAAIVCAAMDYRRWRRWAVPLVILAAVALLLVFIPGLGKTIKGARRWIQLGPVNFQPSELAKLAAIIALAAYAEYRQRRMSRFKEGLLIPGAFLGVMALLILAGRDYGTTLLFLSVGGIMLLVAGVRWRHVLPIALLVLAGFAAAIWSNDVRRTRVLSFLYPEKYAETIGYQAKQAMLAFGSGGLEGRGLGNGRQKTFVPEVHTDFVLSTVGEELGLMGSLAVVVAFMVLLICGIAIAERAADPFGMYLAFGITCLIGLQAFVNIAVVTSLLPNKGLPLPFMSYGGSNLLLMMAAVGILLSVARQGIELERVPANPFAGEPAGLEEGHS